MNALRKIVHEVYGIMLGLALLKIRFASEVSLQLQDIFFCVFLIPYILAKFTSLITLREAKYYNKRTKWESIFIKEVLKGCLVVFFAVIVFFWLKNNSTVFQPFYQIPQFSAFMLSAFKWMMREAQYVIILLYAYVASALPDLGYRSESQISHSILYSVVVSLLALLLVQIISSNALLSTSIAQIVFFLTLLHVLSDVSTGEVLTPFYPLIKRPIVRNQRTVKAMRRVGQIVDYMVIVVLLLLCALLSYRISSASQCDLSLSFLLSQLSVSEAWSLFTALLILSVLSLPLAPVFSIFSKENREESRTMPVPNICKNCGRIIPPRSKTCPWCGAEVSR